MLHADGSLTHNCPCKQTNLLEPDFRAALQWYRCLIGKYVTELETFSHRTIDVPACFISGKSDWGVYQLPGALEMMETTACTQWRGTHLVDGAGHWVQQEQPEEVSRLLLQLIDA